jgi:gluconolactonase
MSDPRLTRAVSCGASEGAIESGGRSLEGFTTLVEGLDHPEGVAWGPDGRVYAGGEAGQVYRIGFDGTVETIVTTGGFMYGVALDGDANMYACDFGRAEVTRISPNGVFETYSAGTDERPLRVPNFAAFADDGSLLVTDSGGWAADDGCLFRVRPGGGTEVWTDAAPAFPNGCCLSADGGSLLLIESHARRILRVEIEDDGSAGAIETVCELPGSQPDGIALAGDGSMLVGCYRPDRLYAISPDGAIDVLAEDPDGVVLNQPANIAFVGEDLERLVVSSLGGWSLVTTLAPSAGLRLRYPRL